MWLLGIILFNKCVYIHMRHVMELQKNIRTLNLYVFFVIAVLLFILTGNVLGFGVFLVFQRLLGVGDGGGRP